MIENTILSNLVHNEEYMRKVFPHMAEEYFESAPERKTFNLISDYIAKYTSLPSIHALKIELENTENLSEEVYSGVGAILEEIKDPNDVNIDWLIDSTEQFCKDRSIFIAIHESIVIIQGEDKERDTGSIPQLLSNALAVSFDNSVGHDYIENAEERFDYYHTKENKVPYDLDYFNEITQGGASKKSLNIILAGTGVGKTLFMTHCAAGNLSAGLNVLYITMEMSEQRISERIDANLLDVTVQDLHLMTKDIFLKRINRIRERTPGKIIVKEYPTAAAGAGHFRHLLHECKIKRNFVPDIIYIDYLNICCSTRLKLGGSTNSYSYIKAIAEELRGLAVEFNVPIFSATQTNREGFTNADVDLTNTAESFGLPATADIMFALISTEELNAMSQLMVKQLKNRWGDTENPKRFVIGVDRSKMKLFNLDDIAQKDVMKKDQPVMDNTDFGFREKKNKINFADLD